MDNNNSNPEENLKTARLGWLRAMASNGDAAAMTEIGNRYANGSRGLSPQPEKAVRWYQAAADAGSLVGARCLAQCYYWGKGIEEDEKKALEIVTPAAEAGDPDAMALMGWLLCSSTVVPRDYPRAADLLEQTVQKNCTAAKYGLALCYAEGNGRPFDPGLALHLIREAVGEGDGNACYFLASWHLSGCDMFADKAVGQRWRSYGMEALREPEKGADILYRAAKSGHEPSRLALLCTDSSKSIDSLVSETERCRWLRAMTEHGNREARLCLAGTYLLGPEEVRNPQAALKLLRDSAIADDPRTGYLNAMAFFKGRGVPCSPERGLQLMTASAEQGFAPACLELSRRAYDGDGCPEDSETGLLWLRQAVKLGDETAKTILGLKYLIGEGVPEDEPQAVRLLAEAAEAGNVRARFALGQCLLKGTGTERDPERGVALMREAAAMDPRVKVQLASKIISGDIGGTTEEARRLLREAGDAFCPDILFRLGRFSLRLGEWGPCPDETEKGMRLIREAAFQGSTEAAEFLRANPDGLPSAE